MADLQREESGRIQDCSVTKVKNERKANTAQCLPDPSALVLFRKVYQETLISALVLPSRLLAAFGGVKTHGSSASVVLPDVGAGGSNPTKISVAAPVYVIFVYILTLSFTLQLLLTSVLCY